MILRRFANAIASQDWPVVCIELIVVIVGIFLGLRVDDWNHLRKDQADEQLFLQRLHSDLLLGEQLSQRVRDRRLSRLQFITDANNVLFGRAGTSELTEEECFAIASTNFFNINVPSLAAYDELVGTGRLNIISDGELRLALVALEQARSALAALIALQTSQPAVVHLPGRYPELITVTSYFDAELNEISAGFRCDTEGMRSSRVFLNQWSANADAYDAYVRDGLKPWSDQFDAVHQLVDRLLGTGHE
jgi:hypothetical protein